MSGIAGVIYKNKNNLPQAVAQISTALSHRGTEKCHTTRREQAGFIARYHTQSAYQSAYQSALYQSTECLVAFDGKLHNHASFKGRYGADKTDCPAKLLWFGYKNVGSDFFDQLEGAFAAVIFDIRSNKIILARDPFGHRPLFYAHNQGNFWFASEMKGILADSNYYRQINQTQIATSLAYGLTTGPDTLIDQLYKVIPGYVSIGEVGTKLEEHVFFNPQNIQPVTQLNTQEEYAEKIWETLGTNIKQQTNHCKKNGLFLSGGIDSALVALKLSKTIGTGTAVTCGYKGNIDNDESQVAEKIAKESGMLFKNIDTSASNNLLESFKAVIEGLENPTRFAIGIPIQRSVSHTKNDIQCLLTGEFADVFFGCEEFPVTVLHEKIKSMSPLTKRLIKSAIPVLNHIKPATNFAIDFEIADTDNLKDYMLNHLRVNKFSLSIFDQPDTKKLSPHVAQLFPRVQHLPIETQWSIISITSILYCFNELFENLSSAAGMDVIFPFQSKSMLAIASAMPYALKFNNGVAKPTMKVLAKNKFSYPFSHFKKKQFSSPIHDWMNNSSELHQALLALESNDALIHDYVDRAAVKNLVRQYKKSEFDGQGGWKRVNNLFILLGMEVWLERFIKQSAESKNHYSSYATL